MKSSLIRSKYLNFFAQRGHAVIPSASLVPENDPTVLFTTAGMQPLVPYLLGQTHPQGKRLVNFQKCLRTVDIDEVGDNRHNTFFEMLGNWSLGDYFKPESIEWSFSFITSKEEGLGIDPSRLYVTVFVGDDDAPEDAESIGLWKEQFASLGIEALVDRPLVEGGRIFRMPKDSNWWGPAGQTGPCGPDTEIYYDTGEKAGLLVLESGMPDFESGRLVEIWNNVFMAYSKDEFGHFHPLQQRNVDTGMGFERIVMTLQEADSIFDTDLFQEIIATLRLFMPQEAQSEKGLRIVADHLRASIMVINDGILPSNKDRGYVLRRLIRRAILHCQIESPDQLNKLITEIIDIVAALYLEPYPELSESANKERILKGLNDEVDKFQKTLAKGKLEIAKQANLTGKEAFDLYQSYGFPLELTKEYAQQQGVVLDEADFELEFKRHQDLSRTASAGQFASGLADHSQATVGYHTATHLLHQALRDVLGDSVKQKGSNLTPERLRFDFSYNEKLTEEQIKKVEAVLNAKIVAGLPVSVTSVSPAEAKAQGAIGLFNDKYGETVTVYSIGNYSKEICTGPHVKNTAELGVFKIIKEEAVSAGVRRIKAVLQ